MAKSERTSEQIFKQLKNAIEQLKIPNHQFKITTIEGKILLVEKQGSTI
jgi:hypothetical protein